MSYYLFTSIHVQVDHTGTTISHFSTLKTLHKWLTSDIFGNSSQNQAIGRSLESPHLVLKVEALAVHVHPWAKDPHWNNHFTTLKSLHKWLTSDTSGNLGPNKAIGGSLESPHLALKVELLALHIHPWVKDPHWNNHFTTLKSLHKWLTSDIFGNSSLNQAVGGSLKSPYLALKVEALALHIHPWAREPHWNNHFITLKSLHNASPVITLAI